MQFVNLYQDFKEEVLFPKIDSLKEKIAPWINQEQTSNQMFSYDEFVGNCDYTKVDKPLYDVPGLKSFITKRRENVISQLCKLNWSCTSGNEVSVQMSNNLILFPNPSTQKTNIAINNLEPEIKYLEYTVYNLIGEIIWQKNIEKDIIVELNSLSLNQGIYIVSAKAGCNLYTQKLVIISE
jgi:hypothetical protein